MTIRSAEGRATGSIRADEALTLAEFRRRTKLGDWALRTLRRQGLRVVTAGGRRFVLGEDFLQFLRGAK